MSILKQSLSTSVIPIELNSLITFDLDSPEAVEGWTLEDERRSDLSIRYRGAAISHELTRIMNMENYPIFSLLEEKANAIAVALQGGQPTCEYMSPLKELGGRQTKSLVDSLRRRNREQAIFMIAPAYLWVRGRLQALYGDSSKTGQTVLRDYKRPGLEYDDLESAAPLKTQSINWDLNSEDYDPEAWDFYGKFTDLHIEQDRFVDLEISSNGVVFPEGGWKPSAELLWELRPASPYGVNAPSPRSLAKRLLEELDAMTDMELIGLWLAIVLGIPTVAEWKRKDGSVERLSVMFEHGREDGTGIWDYMYPEEAEGAPVFHG